MILQSKFTEDKNGVKFAPITTPNAVRFPDGTNLNDHLGGAQVTPIVALGQPSGDAPGLTIIFDSSTSKFCQYLWDDNQGSYTWQEIATLEKAFGYYNDGQGTYGFYEIDNGVLSQTPIERLEVGWYSDFAGFYAQSVGYAGVIMYFDEFGNSYRTVSWDEIDRWNNKSDFSGNYNDLSNKPTIPTVNNATLTIQKNGTQVATFTANASSNVTANITVPTGDLASVNKDGTSSTKYLRGDGTWQTFPTSLPANGGNAATVNSHTVNSDVPANAVFTDTTYSVMGASGSSHASGLVPDTPSTAGTTKFLREDGTWVVPTADVSGKEDKMSIVTLGSDTTLTAAANTLYYGTNVNTLTVTLPSVYNASTVNTIIFRLNMGSTPNLSFTVSGMVIEYAMDFTIEADKGYEISCINYGFYWGIVAHEVDYYRGA